MDSLEIRLRVVCNWAIVGEENDGEGFVSGERYWFAANDRNREGIEDCGGDEHGEHQLFRRGK